MSDLDRIDLTTFYDELDENGIDAKYPPSFTERPFVYRPSYVNEALVRVQQRLGESYGKLESDLVSFLGVYQKTKEKTDSN